MMGPNSFQWCPETGQGAMGTNRSIGSSSWPRGRTSSLWGWRSTGTGCPELLCSLLWRYSRPASMWPCTACSRWPCFDRGDGPDDPQRSCPAPTILWFCECAHLAIACICLACILFIKTTAYIWIWYCRNWFGTKWRTWCPFEILSSYFLHDYHRSLTLRT